MSDNDAEREARASLLEHYSAQTSAHATHLLTMALVAVALVEIRPSVPLYEAWAFAAAFLAGFFLRTFFRTLFWGALSHTVIHEPFTEEDFERYEKQYGEQYGKRYGEKYRYSLLSVNGLVNEKVSKRYKVRSFFGSNTRWAQCATVVMGVVTFAFLYFERAHLFP